MVYIALYDDNGKVMGFEDENKKFYPSEYKAELETIGTIEYKTQSELDALAATQTQDDINQEALAYLASTDWMVIRESEGGAICPADIKVLRAEARLNIVR